MTQSLGQFWGQRIAARREDLKITQVQLAQLCGITQQSISRIEAGTSIPRDGMKMQLARSLGTTPAELFEWPANQSVAS